MSARFTCALPLLASSLLALSGCPRADGPTPSEVPTSVGAEASAAEGEAPGPSEEAQACGRSRSFAEYDWIPDDARLTTAIERQHPELPAALDTLMRMSADPELQLPVFATLDFRNLGLQLANLDRLLAELELEPAELVELHSPGGQFVWLWATDCPPAAVAARVLDRFEIMLRADLEHPGLRRGEGSAEGFPFDILTLGEDRVGLTLVGHGREVGAWLYDAPRGGEDGPGQLLAELPTAPIRSVSSGSALLTNPDGAPPPASRYRTIRVTATDWETAEPEPSS
jgi:hypothetical protein